ncbi:MAG: ABC transporter permease subunit [Alphaproteobacteria bacterium]|nr:ABC transporter permease subunit [Alphaproteobacteria bacterium]
MTTALSRIAPPVVAALILLALWEAAVRLTHAPAVILPPPTAIAEALAANTTSLVSAAAATIVTALQALALAAVLGLGLALALNLSPTLERAVAPIAVTLQVTPVVAIAPLVVIWVGLDHAERAILVLAVVVAFFPVFSAALTGLNAADRDLERLFALYRATRLQRLLRLRLPAAAPFILSGLKIAGGLALIGAVVAEFVAGTGAARGLAWVILEAGNRLQTATMFAALAVLAVLGVAMHAGLSLLERWALARFGPPPSS